MPRETPAPHQPHKDSAADVLALWRCDEAAAVALVDVRGAYTTTLGTLPAVAPGLFTAPAGVLGARVFNATTTFASAPGNTAAHDTLAPTLNGQGYAIEAWIQPAGNTGTIIAYGGTGETQVGNTLMRFGIAAGILQVFWENGAGVDILTPATGMTALVNGTTYHVAVVVRRGTFTCVVEFYVNGVLVARTTGVNAADGGTTTPLFVIGRSSDTATEGNLFFNGTIDDIRVSKWAPSSACIRDSYARGARNFDFATMYASGQWETHLWVFAQWAGAAVADFDRGVGFLDLSSVFGHDHVLGAEYGEDVDNQGADGTIRLRRQVMKQNLALGYNFALINDANFLGVAQRIKIEVADVPVGYGRAGAFVHRQTVFDGCIVGHAWPTNEITLRVVDRIRGLQRAWCKPDGSGNDQTFCIAGDRTLEQFTQDLLTAFLPTAGYKPDDNDQGGGDITVYTPGGASGFNIEGNPDLVTGCVVMSTQNVMQAIEQVAAQIAWRARYRWDDFRKEHRFTLYEPDQTKTWQTTDLDITTAVPVEWNELELSDDEIRNSIDVVFGNSAAPDHEVEYKPDFRNSQDATSITKYGEAYARIQLGSARNIKDATIAQKLADRVKNDLKDPKAHGAVDMLHRFYLDIEDMVRARTDGQRFAVDTDFATVTVRASIDVKTRRTKLAVRDGKPIGGHRRWFDLLIGARGHNKGMQKVVASAPAGPTLTAIAEGLLVEWPIQNGTGKRKYHHTEVHASTSGSGFTPFASTLKKSTSSNHTVLKGLTPNTVWFVKLVHRDSMGNASNNGGSSSATARYLPKVPGVKATLAADITTGLVNGKTPDYFTVAKTLTTEANDHHGDYDNTTGAGGGVYTAPHDGFYLFAAGVEATYAAAHSIRPIIRHYRVATVVNEFVGSFFASGTTANGFLPSNTGFSAAVTDALASISMVWMKAGDTLKFGYGTDAAVSPTAIKATANTYFVVSYYSGGLE